MIKGKKGGGTDWEAAAWNLEVGSLLRQELSFPSRSLGTNKLLANSKAAKWVHLSHCIEVQKHAIVQPLVVQSLCFLG